MLRNTVRNRIDEERFFDRKEDLAIQCEEIVDRINRMNAG